MQDQSLLNLIETTEWCHNIELSQGVVTPGRRNANAAITRTILRRINVEGRDCIDIGTMDGFYGVLLGRRGAQSVLCTDRGNRSYQVGIVRNYTKQNFQYYPGLEIGDLRSLIDKTHAGPVDFVNFAGVLYHMMDPFSGIAKIRGLVKKGGIVLIDTPAILEGKKQNLLLTPDDFYGESTFFVPTLACLQTMLEFAGLRPIDSCYYHMKRTLENQQMVRVAIACRATDPQVFTSDIRDRTKHIIRTNLLENIHYASVFDPMGAPLDLARASTITPYDGGTDHVNIFEQCLQQSPIPFEEDDNILYLSDT